MGHIEATWRAIEPWVLATNNHVAHAYMTASIARKDRQAQLRGLRRIAELMVERDAWTDLSPAIRPGHLDALLLEVKLPDGLTTCRQIGWQAALAIITKVVSDDEAAELLGIAAKMNCVLVDVRPNDGGSDGKWTGASAADARLRGPEKAQGSRGPTVVSKNQRQDDGRHSRYPALF